MVKTKSSLGTASMNGDDLNYGGDANNKASNNYYQGAMNNTTTSNMQEIEESVAHYFS